MTLEELKKYIERPELIERNTGSIVEVGIAFERYVQRIYLIGLRLQGVNYKQAQEIVLRNHDDPISTLNKAMEWILGVEYYKYERAPCLNALKELFDNFSYPLRNEVAHGKSGSYNGGTVILCIKTNIAYIYEIEELLRRNCGHSAFDKATEWGAAIVRRQLSENELGKFGKIKCKNHWSYNRAEKSFNSISFSSNNSFLTPEY